MGGGCSSDQIIINNRVWGGPATPIQQLHPPCPGGKSSQPGRRISEWQLNSCRFCWIEGAVTELCVPGGAGQGRDTLSQTTQQRAQSDCHQHSVLLHCCTSLVCLREWHGEHPGKKWEPKEGVFSP